MALHLRNLISESFSEDVAEFCDPYCDDSNKSASCPTSCFSFCPDYCKIDLFSVPPTYSDYEPSPDKTHLSFSRIVLIAVSAAVAVLVVAALFLKTRQMRRRRGRDPPPAATEEERMDREFLDQDRGPAAVEHHIWYINTVGLTQSVIDSIAVCRYKAGEGLVEGTECSVCLTEFQEDETLRLLPKCSHAFHVPCIDTWLRSHTNCPLCRAPIVRSADGDVAVAGGEDEEESLTFQEGEEQGRETGEDSENRETQPIRRSVSMDSISALKINLAVSNPLREGNSNSSLNSNRVVLRKLSSSTSLRGSSSSLIRSLSCSGRLFLSAHGRSRSRSSVLPL